MFTDDTQYQALAKQLEKVQQECDSVGNRRDSISNDTKITKIYLKMKDGNHRNLKDIGDKLGIIHQLREAD